MSDGVKNEVSKSGSKKILALLDSLRQSPSGALLYSQVERLLFQNDDGCCEVETAYADMLSMTVQLLAAQAESGSLLQVQLLMLDKLMQPPLNPAEISTLSGYLAIHAEKVGMSGSISETALRDALSPLMAGFGISAPIHVAPLDQQPSVVSPAVDSLLDPLSGGHETNAEPEQLDPRADVVAEEETKDFDQTELPGGGSVETECVDTAPEVVEETTLEEEVAPIVAEESVAEPVPEEREGDISHDDEDPFERRLQDEGGQDDTAGEKTGASPVPAAKLEKHRRDFRTLQHNLATQVSETTAQAEGFADTLQSILENVRGARSGDDVDTAKRSLLSELQRMLSDHHNFSESLDSTAAFLTEIESNSQELSDELSRVRLLSLTDELTELPNRRAFLRRLEDEVGRVQRYGYPVALAVIDLDHFKEVNDVHGHAAGDEALRVFAKHVLSAFRHHDLVARYGGEEFVVLLPNTDEHGATRALHKVQRRAMETRYQFNGNDEPVPQFSAGIALYKPGETPSAFIERADNALYQAKRLGRNRVEMDGITPDTKLENIES